MEVDEMMTHKEVIHTKSDDFMKILLDIAYSIFKGRVYTICFIYCLLQLYK